MACRDYEEHHGRTNMKIAVLDDNVAVGEMLQDGLQLIGHTVSVFFSSSQFLAALSTPTTAQHPFDLIIVDLLLSEGISGVEVIAQARRTFPDLPAILISAGSSWDIEAARRAMPDIKVLRKPFRLITLLTMVKELSN
jgi:DNA-binding response OmpR family regulator